jgi:hypothetical protein
VNRVWHVLVLGIVLLRAAPALSRAQSVPVPIPNGSFESPATPYVTTFIDSWQETPKPDSYLEGGGFLWDQLTGLFVNTAPGATDHIDNCDGKQAAYLFAVPQAGWFQDFDSKAWNDSAPSHAFDILYEAGKAYELTVGVIGGGGNMAVGASLELALYYRDASSNQVAVAATTVTNSLAAFPVHTHLVDYRVHVPFVQAGDAWAGQHLGVRILSTVTPDQQGGYWDLDNVRLVATAEPIYAVNVAPTTDGLRLSWPSVTGFQYQVEISDDLQTWAALGAARAGTGDVLAEPVMSSGNAMAFFRVRASVTP